MNYDLCPHQNINDDFSRMSADLITGIAMIYIWQHILVYVVPITIVTVVVVEKIFRCYIPYASHVADPANTAQTHRHKVGQFWPTGYNVGPTLVHIGRRACWIASSSSSGKSLLYVTFRHKGLLSDIVIQ